MLAALALLAAFALSGCGKGKDIAYDKGGFPGPDQSNFQGVFASEGGVGRMGIVISASSSSLAPTRNAPAAAVSAIGALTLENGASVSLAGTYDTGSDSVHLNGAGYDFDGRSAWLGGVPMVTGTYASPGDDGAFAVALVNDFGPHRYCGRLYVTGGAPVGRLAYLVSGITILGAACFDAEADPVALQGELDRSTAKPRVDMAGTSATRDLSMHGAFDEEADLSAGSWTSTGAAGDASGTWSVDICP